MKRFLRFVRKEFIHIFRDRLTLMLLLGLPVILVLAFGFALTSEVKVIHVAIATPSHSPVVERIYRHIDASASVGEVRLVPVQADLDELLRRGEVHAVVVLPGRLDEELLAGTQPRIELRLDAMDPNTSALIGGQIEGLLYEAIVEELSQYAPLIALQPAARSPFRVETSTTLLYNPEMRAPYYFVPSVMSLVLMIVCALMTSVSIVREKEYGSMEVLLTSPANPLTILLAKMVPYFVLSVVNVVTILLLSRFVLGVPIVGSVAAIFVVSLLFIVVSLMIGMLVSTVTDSQMVAMLICGAGFLLPVTMLSGMFFPIDSMPRLLQYMAHAIPATWYSIAIKKLMIQGLGWEAIVRESLVLLTMGGVLTGLALLNFKRKLE